MRCGQRIPALTAYPPQPRLFSFSAQPLGYLPEFPVTFFFSPGEDAGC